MRIRYLNDISFEFCIEAVAFNDMLETEFDVLLDMYIIPKLNIGLTNIYRKKDVFGNRYLTVCRISSFDTER